MGGEDDARVYIYIDTRKRAEGEECTYGTNGTKIEEERKVVGSLGSKVIFFF